MKIVRSIRIEGGAQLNVKVKLPPMALPLRFIKQGFRGLFLWYSEGDGFFGKEHEFTFHFVPKDGAGQDDWNYMQDVKYGNYYMVFKEY